MGSLRPASRPGSATSLGWSRCCPVECGGGLGLAGHPTCMLKASDRANRTGRSFPWRPARATSGPEQDKIEESCPPFSENKDIVFETSWNIMLIANSLIAARVTDSHCLSASAFLRPCGAQLPLLLKRPRAWQAHSRQACHCPRDASDESGDRCRAKGPLMMHFFPQRFSLFPYKIHFPSDPPLFCFHLSKYCSDKNLNSSQYSGGHILNAAARS